MAVGTGFGTRSIADVRKSFFDADRILKSMDRATHRVLSRHGAFVRTRSRTSIRYRKDPAPPGRPPSAHKTVTRLKTNRKGVTKRQASSPYRDGIYFSYDKAAKRVVIGPVIFPSARRKGTPERLEYGGTVAGKVRVPIAGMPERDEKGRYLPLGMRTRLVPATLRYEPRPAMHPAHAAELPKSLASLRDSMR
jgi:hypothetical protein